MRGWHGFHHKDAKAQRVAKNYGVSARQKIFFAILRVFVS